jgi:hypothetical protein
LLFQFEPSDVWGSNNFAKIEATTPNNGTVAIRETSGNLLAIEFTFNGGSTFLAHDFGTIPSVATNVEVIYDSQGSGAARLQSRTWAVGGTPGSFANAAFSSGANANTDQFTLLTLNQCGDVSSRRYGKIFISDDINEDLSALLSSQSIIPKLNSYRRRWH